MNLIFVFFASLLFGFNILNSMIIAGVVYATSSSITAKLLEDKKRLANQETEFILALLIFEDLVAPVVVSLLVSLNKGQDFSLYIMFVLFLKICLLISGAIIIGYFGFRKLTNFISSQLEKDFISLFSVGIALLYSGFAVYLGLSEILGAFLAGVILSESGKSSELAHVIFPVRDLTLPFFFFWFGTTINLGSGVSNIPFLLFLILYSILGKIITGFYGGRLYGLSKKVSLRAGLSLIQRGEFSIIIAALASDQLKVFGGIYVFVIALSGSLFFSKAPKIANRIYPPRKKLNML